jgi:Flp pilus assembly pilin Flp
MWNDLKTRMFLLVAPVRDEEGQALVEYSLILALVGVALIVALGFLAGGIEGEFTKVITALK